MRQRTALVLLALLASTTGPVQAAPASAAAAIPCPDPVSLEGAWESEGGGSKLLLEGDRIIVARDGALTVATILRREKEAIQVRYQGLLATWPMTCKDGQLSVTLSEPLILRRLAQVPPDLDVSAASLPPPKDLPPGEAKAIEQELLRRAASDQAAAKDPALRPKRPEILADNLRYLKELTARVGWIDIPRFGQGAASAAVLILKHGSDLRLMLAALPIFERDVKVHGGSGEMFSVLYDEIQITLGKRQRYGTQLLVDDQGRPFILPLEDVTKVDMVRKEIGILSFADYLKLVSENMGGGSVRVAGVDE
jgi:hypothetical protein